MVEEGLYWRLRGGGDVDRVLEERLPARPRDVGGDAGVVPEHPKGAEAVLLVARGVARGVRGGLVVGGVSPVVYPHPPTPAALPAGGAALDRALFRVGFSVLRKKGK